MKSGAQASASRELQRRAQFRALLAQARSPNKAEREAARYVLKEQFNHSVP